MLVYIITQVPIVLTVPGDRFSPVAGIYADLELARQMLRTLMMTYHVSKEVEPDPESLNREVSEVRFKSGTKLLVRLERREVQGL